MKVGDDFANVARFIQLVVTMPPGRSHTFVPCEDLRAVARELQRLYAVDAGRTDPNAPDADGIYVVRVHESLVQQLRDAPSEPVTVHMEFQPNGELMFVVTRHDCPAAAPTLFDRLPPPPPGFLEMVERDVMQGTSTGEPPVGIFGLPVVESAALDGMEPPVIGSWCQLNRSCMKADGHEGDCWPSDIQNGGGG
jgi:hypothetical protein